MNWLTDYLGYTAGAVLAIIPIVNPLGAVPLVMTVAAHLPEAERQRLARVYQDAMRDPEVRRGLARALVVLRSLGSQAPAPTAPTSPKE